MPVCIVPLICFIIPLSNSLYTRTIGPSQFAALWSCINEWRKGSPDQAQGSTQSASLDLIEPTRPRILELAEWGQKSGLKEVIGKVLEKVGKSHWTMVGFLALGVAIDVVVTKYPNDHKCHLLLESMIIAAKTLLKLKDSLDADCLKCALQVIIENAAICMDYLNSNNFLKFLTAKTVEEQLKSSNRELIRILGVVNLYIDATNNHLIKEMMNDMEKLHEEIRRPTTYQTSLVENLVECSSAGIDNDVEYIVDLLKDGRGGLPFVVVIYGLGGMGKSTLARASIQKYASDCVEQFSDLAFSKIIAHDNCGQRDTDIIVQQRILVEELTGEKCRKFANAEDGRCALRLILENHSSLILIDNITDKGYLSELFPKDLRLRNGNVLKIIVTTRIRGVEAELYFHFEKAEREISPLSDATATQVLRDLIWKDADTQEDDFPDETHMIKVAAELCKGCPLLLSIYGNHTRQRRNLDEYMRIRRALLSGDFCRDPNSENISEKILYVYHELTNDLKKAFMLAFHLGYYILCEAEIKYIELLVPKEKIENLEKIGLLKIEGKYLIIHDILQDMAGREYFVKSPEENDDISARNFSGLEWFGDMGKTRR